MSRGRVHLKISYGPEPCVKWTACGLIGRPSHGATFDKEAVTCLNCQYTKEYRAK